MIFAPFEHLETPRLLLRRLDPGDVYDYYERLYGDGSVTRFLDFDSHLDIGESMEHLNAALERYAEEGFYRWALERKEDECLVGVAELKDFRTGENACGFFCMLAQDCWGMGYGFEAMTEIVKFAFGKLEVEKITADHMEGNTAAGALMQKLGMSHTGVAREKYEKYCHMVDAQCYELVRARDDALTANDYQRLAMKTLNPELSRRDILINGVMGLCGESGEAIDIVKKHLHQGHPLDREKLIRELGDIAWYLAETAYALDVSLEKVLQGNIEKLKARYPQGFDTEQSVNRK